MKKILSILLAVAISMMTFSVTGTGVSYYEIIEDPSGKYICYEKEYRKSVSIQEYLGNETDVVIPSEISGYKVVEIASDAFACNKKIKSVVIPKTVEEISSFAFKSCENLESIAILNDSATVYADSFEGTAFFNNKKNWENDALYLNTFLLAVKPEISGEYTVKNGTKVIAGTVFANNTKLINVVLPDTVLFIPFAAFEGCTSLKNVTLSEKTEYIDFSAFENCKQLSSIAIPKDVREIKMDGFLNCSNLKNIKIESSDIDIDSNAFDGTAYYNDSSNWDNGVFYVDKHLLLANPDLVKGDYLIKEGTKTMSSYAFRECEKLTSITIPKGVKKIAERTFINCTNLKKVSIPEGVISIGFFAFDDCNSLETIIMPSTIEEIARDAFNNTAYCNDKNNWENGVLYIGYYLIDVNEDFKTKNYMVKDGTKIVAEWGMAGSTELETLTIPDSVVAINEQAFNQCEKLKTITIPDSVKSIGKDAFIFCGDVTIKGYKGSYAEQYAKDNNIKFELFGETTENEKVEVTESTSSKNTDDIKVTEMEKNEISVSEEFSEYVNSDYDESSTMEVVEKPIKPEKVGIVIDKTTVITGIVVSLVIVAIAGVVFVVYKKRELE